MFWKVVRAWPLLLSLLGLIAAFAVMETTLKAHEEAIIRNSEDHREMMDRLTRVETIAEMIPEMRQDIKLLLRNGNGKVRSSPTSR